MLDTFEADGVTEALTSSVRALYNALLLLEQRAGVAPGEPFRTTRVAMIVEANLSGITTDCSLYVLEGEGLICREGKPGAGTTITILGRSA